MLRVKKKDIQKWTNALRSGEYAQTKHTLQDKNGYCCLGVACKLFIPKNKLNLDTKGRLKGDMPEDQKSPKWLKKINDDFFDVTGSSLDVLNDSKRYSFAEIADLLELIYIHKAL